MRDWFKRSWKNITIVLLLISLVVLTILTWFGDMQSGSARRQRILGAFPNRGEQIQSNIYSGYREYDYTMSILSPVRASVRSGGAMSHYTARTAVRELFERASAVLASAMTTALDRREVSAYQWRAILEQDLLLFDFEGEMPIAMLSAVMGIADYGVKEQQTRYIALFSDGDALTLALKSGDSAPVLYTTGLLPDELTALVQEYGGGTARFACEDPRLARLLPDMFVVLEDRPAPRVLVRSALFTDYTDAASERVINSILGGLGYNAYTTGSYIESDDTRVYVEEFRTLRIRPDGALSYYAPIPPDEAVPVTERSAIISSAASLLDRLTAGSIGDMSIYIQRAFYDADSERYVILFGCTVDGILLSFEDGYFARLEYVGTSLVSAHMTVSGYLLTESRTELIPDVQAAATVGSKSSTFELRYVKTQNDEYRANWYYIAP